MHQLKKTLIFLDKYFDVNQIVYDNDSYKNKVAMFLDTARNINVDISECLIIEDSLSGIKNAYKAGCRNIIVVSSADDYSSLPGVIKVISDFDEINQ